MEHFVFEQRTSMDKNFDTLAITKAECLHARRCKLCTADCSRCSKGLKFNACYRQLALCDQLYIDNTAEQVAYSMDIDYYEYVQRVKQKKSVRLFIIIITVLLLMFVVCKAHGQSIYVNYYTDDEYIVDILEETKKNIRDINEDGIINCVDKAIIYKRLWDRKYDPTNCEIVRNFHVYTGWHHLFIRVRGAYGSKWLRIEPSAGPDNYRMQDFWGDEYEQWYDVYYETDRWLQGWRL